MCMGMTWRYLITPDDTPMHPISEYDFEAYLKLLRMQMCRHNEEYEWED